MLHPGVQAGALGVLLHDRAKTAPTLIGGGSRSFSGDLPRIGGVVGKGTHPVGELRQGAHRRIGTAQGIAIPKNPVWQVDRDPVPVGGEQVEEASVPLHGGLRLFLAVSKPAAVKNEGHQGRPRPVHGVLRYPFEGLQYVLGRIDEEAVPD